MLRRLGFVVPVALVLPFALLGCFGKSDSFTLYRNSPTDRTTRIHIATFDAKDGEKYNAGNCDIAAGLFAQQAGVTVRYWCERGPFKS